MMKIYSWIGGGAPRPIGYLVCNSDVLIQTITLGTTQRSSRIGYSGRGPPGPVHVSQNLFPSLVLSCLPAVLISLATLAIPPSHCEPTTPELEGGGVELTSRRQNMAVGVEDSILDKPCSLI